MPSVSHASRENVTSKVFRSPHSIQSAYITHKTLSDELPNSKIINTLHSLPPISSGTANTPGLPARSQQQQESHTSETRGACPSDERYFRKSARDLPRKHPPSAHTPQRKYCHDQRRCLPARDTSVVKMACFQSNLDLLFFFGTLSVACLKTNSNGIQTVLPLPHSIPSAYTYTFHQVSGGI